jgi:hypothetical protein
LAGDFTLLFGTISDTPGAPTANVIQEEVSIAMTWPQLKMLSLFLNDVVEAIESEAGPIPIAGEVADKQLIKNSITQTLRALKFPSPR